MAIFSISALFCGSNRPATASRRETGKKTGKLGDKKPIKLRSGPPELCLATDTSDIDLRFNIRHSSRSFALTLQRLRSDPGTLHRFRIQQHVAWIILENVENCGGRCS
nr:hypothetical protein Iba_chr05eCG3120 [Ipomoea batatas]